MDSVSAGLVTGGGMAGGALGILVFWNRERAHGGKVERAVVLVMGCVMFAVGVWCFGKGLGVGSGLFSVGVTLLIAAWTAVLQTVIHLRVPRWLEGVSVGEEKALRVKWSGVRLFGKFLRSTALRRLGGRVYLEECGGDAECVLNGMREAEGMHYWAAIFMGPWMVYWCEKGMWAAVGWSAVVNFLLNVYPVLHLRLARGRVERFLGRGGRIKIKSKIKKEGMIRRG